MSEPFLAEIKMFAGNFAPRGYALCEGQLVGVSQNDALFSLLGTIYGGDGRTTFGLPDLRGRLPVHAGSGPGLTPRALGFSGGRETVTLTSTQMPSHDHDLMANSASANVDLPAGAVPADTAPNNSYIAAAPDVLMDETSSVGGSRPHNNLMPFLCVNYIIALVGIYPSRT